MNMTAPTPETTLAERDLEILQDAFKALRKTTGLEARLIAERGVAPTGYPNDALVDITDLEGRPRRYDVVIKHIDLLETALLLKEQFYEMPDRNHWLLIAPRLPPKIADYCKKLKIPFIDTAGNAYLQAPGMFVFVRGHQLEKPKQKLTNPDTKAGARRTGTPTALRIIFTLLCQPQNMLNAPYRNIVDAAGVALGTIGDVFNDLNERGITVEGKLKGQRRLLEPGKLLNEWVTNYPTKLRPKLNLKRFIAQEPDWWKKAELTRYDALWGGEVAADKLTGHLKPATFTLYVRPETGRKNITKLVIENRLRADPRGDIEILDAFWTLPIDPEYPDVVPPILAYADLVTTTDPRNLETAKLIRERHIDHALNQG